MKKTAFIFSLVFLLCSLSFGFGKNKVQYENLEWRYSTTPHFQIYHHQNQGDIPKISAYWIEKAYAQLSKDFGFKHRKPVPLIIYNSPNRFKSTNIIMEILPEGVGGFTELFKNRIVVPFTGSYEDYRHVLHHELVHAFQYGIIYDQFGSSLVRSSSLQMPLWFAEGTAEYLSSGWNVESDMFLMDRAINSSIPMPGYQMGGYMAYKGGQSFFHFLEATRGKENFSGFLKAFRDSKNVELSLENIFHKSIEELGKEWRQQLRRIYWPEIGRRDNPKHTARALTSTKKTKSNFNLKPRLSPDGTKIAYFSDKRDYTRIIVTDLKGKTITEISQYGYGGYFESFHPFRSGMSWSPESDRIAFVSGRKGKDEIRIINIYDKSNVRVLSPDFSLISSPDWSPSGESIVFIGLRQDRSDLFLYNLESDSLTRLTSTIAYESNPRFSPDGKGIIYSAQDSTGLIYRNRDSRFRPVHSLYHFDIATQKTRKLTHAKYNATNPSFSPDGEHILYISDKNGINNMYIAPFATPDSGRPITDFIGGCLDPDWARNDKTIAFCLFQKQGWHIWVMKKPLEKRKDSSLTLTWWAQCLQDTTLDFFDRRTAIKDSTHRADSIATTKELTDSTSDSTTATTILASSDIIVEKETPPAPEDSSTTTDTTVTGIENDSSESSAPTEIAEASVEQDSLTDTSKTADSSETEEQFSFEDMDSEPYRLKFSPDMVSVGLAVNSVYGYGGAGQIVLSDVMGNHRITLAGDVQGKIDEYAHVFASYLNLEHRLDFGVGGFFNRDYTYSGILAPEENDSAQTSSDSLVIVSELYYHDTKAGGLLHLSYPFSMFSRISFNSYISYIQRQRYRLHNFSLEKESTSPESFYIILPSLSATFDNIVWGITGPVNGTRAEARLVTSPPLDIVDRTFISFDFDFRKYFHFARKFVLATKFAAGASFPLDKNRPARQFFLGGNEYWLFFDPPNRENYEANINNIFYSEFVVPFRGWNYLDITGPRFAVANVEFRFPFVREFSLAWPLPIAFRYINGAVFADVGNAWSKGDEHDLFPLPQDIYGGIGFGLRANLGMFILRFDRAWKTDWRTYVKSPKSYISLGAEF
ncbi:MAG: BamA/TamA family outer membrane protein [Chitinivibrionales bacterium]|nr:BamA/TamA family outer membrane protein [Chitinivibrionales bacterium]